MTWVWFVLHLVLQALSWISLIFTTINEVTLCFFCFLWLVGFQLGAQNPESLLPVFSVALHLMIILHAAGAPVVGCLFWSVIVAGYGQIIIFMSRRWLSSFRFKFVLV